MYKKMTKKLISEPPLY